MIAIVAADQAETIGATFAAAGETVSVIGRVVEGQGVAYRGALA
jgi:phosphoribosylformylglycinamidine cyclo-ligase